LQAGSAFFGLIFSNKTDEEKEECKKKIRDNLKRVVAYLVKDDKSYICGKEPGFTDYMMWPFIERLLVLQPELIKEQSELQAYCERMEEDPAVKACRHSNDLFKEYFQRTKSGDNTYDIGTVTDY